MPDWTKDPAGWMAWTWGLGKECLADAGRFDECIRFWGVLGAAVGILCAVGVLVCIAHFLRERAKVKRALEKLAAEQAVAPPEEMARFQWTGDDLVDPGLSTEEIARRIREAKMQKDLESNVPPTAKGDKALGIDVLHR